MAVQFLGDWQRMFRWLDELPDRLDGLLEDIRDEALEHLAERAKARILGKAVRPPNAPSTVRRKGFNWPLVETGEYVNMIGVYGSGEDKWAGLPDGVHAPSGLSYSVLWRIHTFGVGRIPPRSHFTTSDALAIVRRRLRAAGLVV